MHRSAVALLLGQRSSLALLVDDYHVETPRKLSRDLIVLFLLHGRPAVDPYATFTDCRCSLDHDPAVDEDNSVLCLLVQKKGT